MRFSKAEWREIEGLPPGRLLFPRFGLFCYALNRGLRTFWRESRGAPDEPPPQPYPKWDFALLDEEAGAGAGRDMRYSSARLGIPEAAVMGLSGFAYQLAQQEAMARQALQHQREEALRIRLSEMARRR